MKKAIAMVLIMILSVSMLLTGCNSSPLNPKNPVTLVMWHNYGGEMQKIMLHLVDEFNSSVGKEEGIVIDVKAVSSSSELNKALTLIANGDPGAPDMPDIFTGYPKIGMLFQEKGMLCNLDTYFTEDELSAYVDAFVEEGRFADGGLYVFPAAKSTEILYLNQTLFDEFAAATGAEESKLATFEGIAELSEQYYQWSGGKQFFGADSWFNIAEVGMEQLGSDIFKDEKLSLDNNTYKQIFETFYAPAVKGGVAIYDGYTSDLAKTGDIVCSTGSSAGILFYGDTITYADGTEKKVEYSLLPYPVFEDGEKIALQRGGGLMVAKNDEKKEYAASVFIKWFTAAEQNMQFVASTAYLPVTKKAFNEDVPEYLKTAEDARIQKMLTAVLSMHEEYQFFYAPHYNDFDAVSSKYEEDFYNLLTADQKSFAENGVYDPAAALNKFK